MEKMLELLKPYRLYLVFTLWLNFLTSFSQNSKLDSLNEIKADLNSEINSLKSQIIEIDIQINKLKRDELMIAFSDSLPATINKGARLYPSLPAVGEPIKIFENESIVLIVDYNQYFFGVLSDTIFGYIVENYFQLTDDVKQYRSIKIEEEKEREMALQKIAQEEAIGRSEEMEKKYIERYGKTTYQKLQEGYYWVGMTDEMAAISLGSPIKVNRTVGSWGVHEQWVYESIYLYFENGVLTAYQN